MKWELVKQCCMGTFINLQKICKALFRVQIIKKYLTKNSTIQAFQSTKISSYWMYKQTSKNPLDRTETTKGNFSEPITKQSNTYKKNFLGEEQRQLSIPCSEIKFTSIRGNERPNHHRVLIEQRFMYLAVYLFHVYESDSSKGPLESSLDALL